MKDTGIGKANAGILAGLPSSLDSRFRYTQTSVAGSRRRIMSVALGTFVAVDTRAPSQSSDSGENQADRLRDEGWDARVTPPIRDFGLDLICEQPGRRLGVQVKMYGGGRPINAQMVMQLYGAATYQDCSEMMIATDGRVLDDARRVAKKLGIEIRYMPVPAGTGAGAPSNRDRLAVRRSPAARESAWTQSAARGRQSIRSRVTSP